MDILSQIRQKPLYVLFVVFAAAIVLGVFFYSTQGRYAEAQALSQADYTFEEYQDYLEMLAEEKGGAYAFEVMRRTQFKEHTDLHLLGHVVGDVLFKQEGIDGIHICDQDFRNACSHSIVVGLFFEQGVDALSVIAEACREAPGGSGAYTMCFHGLGHGILAYSLYDIEQTVALCKKVGTAAYHDREYAECVGGAVMELLDGWHDRTQWERVYDTYVDEQDPLALCLSDTFPDEVKDMCVLYATPLIFKASGVSQRTPESESLANAFSLCERLGSTWSPLHYACYGGVGKEFVGFVSGRDTQHVGSLPDSKLVTMREWCSLAGTIEGEAACNSQVLASLFWGGENEPDASFAYCTLAPEGSRAWADCYEQLRHDITYYLSETPKGLKLCTQLPEQFRAGCGSAAP